MPFIGPTEALVILAVLVLLFGGAKLPELAKGLGKSVKEFKKAVSDSEDTPKEPSKENAPDPPKQSP